MSTPDDHIHFERLAAARVGHFATATIDGRPHVVPFCFALAGETAYSLVDEKPKRSRTGLRRLRNLDSNPRASLLVHHYEEDWSRLWFVMAEGEAETVDDDADYARGLAALREKYPQYRGLAAARATHPMIRLRIARLVAWESAPGATRTGLDSQRQN